MYFHSSQELTDHPTGTPFFHWVFITPATSYPTFTRASQLLHPRYRLWKRKTHTCRPRLVTRCEGNRRNRGIKNETKNEKIQQNERSCPWSCSTPTEYHNYKHQSPLARYERLPPMREKNHTPPSPAASNKGEAASISQPTDTKKRQDQAKMLNRFVLTVLVFAAFPLGADGRGMACPLGALGFSAAAAVADLRCFPDSGFFSTFKDFSRFGPALPAVHMRNPVG